MHESRDAKLIASAILIATGGLCVALSDHRDAIGAVVGLIFLLVGVPLLVLQWRRPNRRFPRGWDDDLASDSNTGIKASKDLEI